MRLALSVTALVLGAAAVGTAATAPVLAADAPFVSKTATLADVPLGEFQNALLPGTVADDRGVMLGGIGSGLFALGGSEYWTVTDRGPNGEIGDTRTFIVPDFTPTLVRVKM